ncbi:tRNA (adenine(22)-N(1))-methyltransferase [Caldalkalibacillus salinus]|uniref:tRNA (adenine(22)-N(1))-methyltransferase n=1 Tax=Caldalkalibacillus salinus TaxID=2803787 RepID=UPI001923C4D5|nr:tRNA (adenine(22)-N(1))-methyltransferase TrmK [Caldalkalibacillus salinus]
MNEHQLSKRLMQVAEYVPHGSRMADIGSDHAYLPIFLVLNGKISFAIAGEVNDGPYESAKAQVDRLGLQGVVDVRKGDGLAVIDAEEVDVICIAGMGGALIRQILSEQSSKLNQVKRLILQPNVASHILREWCLENGWELKDERMVAEDDKYYEVLIADRGTPSVPYEQLPEAWRLHALTMGPFLLRHPNQAFIDKWTYELNKRKKILESLDNGVGPDVEEKKKLIETEMAMIQEGLKYGSRSDDHPMV